MDGDKPYYYYGLLEGHVAHPRVRRVTRSLSESVSGTKMIVGPRRAMSMMTAALEKQESRSKDCEDRQKMATSGGVFRCHTATSGGQDPPVFVRGWAHREVPPRRLPPRSASSIHSFAPEHEHVLGPCSSPHSSSR